LKYFRLDLISCLESPYKWAEPWTLGQGEIKLIKKNACSCLLNVKKTNINAYVQAVNSFSVLTQEEEKKLAEDLYYREDVESARRLVMAHLRFVVHIAKSYAGYGLNQGDLIQEGNVGLMKAVKRFNPEKGVRLVSASCSSTFEARKSA